MHILAYHAGLIDGPDYAQNDHVALREDLEVIAHLGLRVLPLQTVVDALLGRRDWSTLDGAVALTCDDGTAFDALPGREYGAHGPQPSLLGVLQAWIDEDPASRSQASLTSFLIASPEARAAMDRHCLFDRNDLDSDWWAAAQGTGHMVFGNHSWDHNHPILPPEEALPLSRGDFFAVDDEAKADYEIAQAQAFLAEALGQRPTCFAYPFGHVPEFLRSTYLPRRGPELGLEAAFTTETGRVRPDSDRWALPRSVCRWHWKSPAELEALLTAD
jgi:hypothetical protein